MPEEIERRFNALEKRDKEEDYNFKHFTTSLLLEDGRRTVEARGILPGELAPDFELPQVGGETLRLSDLRGQPTILHFGSFS
jgi:cytochrome oxidase Cu insertion factor (SCO1/SenC/PrrC family)